MKMNSILINKVSSLLNAIKYVKENINKFYIFIINVYK